MYNFYSKNVAEGRFKTLRMFAEKEKKRRDERKLKWDLRIRGDEVIWKLRDAGL